MSNLSNSIPDTSKHKRFDVGKTFELFERQILGAKNLNIEKIEDIDCVHRKPCTYECCRGCAKDFDPNHHPNNSDCGYYEGMKIVGRTYIT